MPKPEWFDSLSVVASYLWSKMNGWTLVSSLINFVLLAALLFKSALNQIVVDWHTRRQAQRDRRRRLLLELHERMLGFHGEYAVLQACSSLNTVDAFPGVQEIANDLEKKFLERFQESIEFINRNELEMPSSIRALLVELRGAMRIENPDSYPDSFVDPAAVQTRVSNVTTTVEGIQREIRRLTA